MQTYVIVTIAGQITEHETDNVFELEPKFKSMCKQLEGKRPTWSDWGRSVKTKRDPEYVIFRSGGVHKDVKCLIMRKHPSGKLPGMSDNWRDQVNSIYGWSI